MRRFTAIARRGVLGAAVCASFAACDRPAPDSSAAAAWREDCAPIARPAPLSVEAAKQAHRKAERSFELRLREAATPGFFLNTLHESLDAGRIAAGELCLGELADLGELVFEHEFNFADGLGNSKGSTQPSGPFRRVHEGMFGGPETLSCPSCHWIGGPNGAGAETDNAFLSGDGRRPATGDARNPPALIALGVVQALADEMTSDLHGLREELLHNAANGKGPREIVLTTKGVDFGVLRLMDDGAVDATAVEGIDADLIVKPFGWKGTLPDFEVFADEALQVHMGIQSDSLLAQATSDVIGDGDDRTDPDGDGVRGEFGAGPRTALNAHLALLELPIARPLIQDRAIGPAAEGLLAPTTTSFVDDFQHGRRQFHELGCAGCHTPMLVLDDPVVMVDGMPPIDLSRDMQRPALAYDAGVGGYPVWLFSDLKRHDMGAANAARHIQNGVARREYLTPRLWGVADSAPYLHDGRAPSFDYAIAGHDGEGAAARDGFAKLDRDEKGALRVYLMSLRRARRVIVP